MINNFQMIEIENLEHFNKEFDYKGFIVIKFYIKGCHHCISLANRVFDSLNGDKSFSECDIKFLNIEVSSKENVDIVKELSKHSIYSVTGVPCTLLFMDKKMLQVVEGNNLEKILSLFSEEIEL